MHKYLVSLSIVADDLDEGELSRILDLKPSVFHRRGELRSQRVGSSGQLGCGVSIHLTGRHIGIRWTMA
jgi:hypothetical protein